MKIPTHPPDIYEALKKAGMKSAVASDWTAYIVTMQDVVKNFEKQTEIAQEICQLTVEGENYSQKAIDALDRLKTIERQG